MGRTSERIEISVSMSNHFSEQDEIDREGFNWLCTVLRLEIAKIEQDYPNLVITTMGLG